MVAPFDYTGLIWATVLGWVFWREAPDALAYLGAAFIAGSGIYIALARGSLEAAPRQR